MAALSGLPGRLRAGDSFHLALPPGLKKEHPTSKNDKTQSPNDPRRNVKNPNHPTHAFDRPIARLGHPLPPIPPKITDPTWPSSWP
jgi:hypothetical protein